jgi:F-type H+-transporting ATPase subunit alpha
MAQFRELAAFAQFGTADLDRATLNQLERGRRLTELLKQPQYQPLPMEKEAMIFFAATQGFVDDVPVDRVRIFESEFYKFMDSNHPEIGRAIAQNKAFNDQIQADLRKAIGEFKQVFK